MFSALPGHVDQMTGAANIVPFLSLAVLLGYVALRSGSFLPGFLVHLTIDLAALAFFAGELPAALRVLVDVGALVGVVLGLMLAGRRLGLRRRVPRVIDLRATFARSRPSSPDPARAAARVLVVTPPGPDLHDTGPDIPNGRRASTPCSPASTTHSSATRSQPTTVATPPAPSCSWCTTPATSTRSRSSRRPAAATSIPTPASRRVVRTRRPAAGCGLAAVDALAPARPTPRSSSVRPPGHHADRRARPGLLPVQQRRGRRRRARRRRANVSLIVDWDVHHGNGTQDIFWDDPTRAATSRRTSRPRTREPGGVDETGGADARRASP